MLPMPQPFPVRLFTPSVQYVSTHRVIHTIHRLLWISQSYPQTVDNLLLTFVLQAGIAGAVYTDPYIPRLMPLLRLVAPLIGLSPSTDDPL